MALCTTGGARWTCSLEVRQRVKDARMQANQFKDSVKRDVNTVRRSVTNEVENSKAPHLLKKFFGTMTPADDAAATFFADLERGRFICDSVPGLAADVFGRRSAYVLGGRRPSEMRAKRTPTSATT